MARSEKDRALLFLAHASVTEYVRADAFILYVPFRGGTQACPARGFWVRSLRVYPDFFIDRVSSRFSLPGFS